MLNDLRFASRTLAQKPGFALTTVIIVALGTVLSQIIIERDKKLRTSGRDE